MLGSGMNRRERADQLESVASAPGDQGVEAVLRSEGVGGVTSATSEGGDAPLVGIRTVGCVPGLMGPGEVADTEVDHSDRRRRGVSGSERDRRGTSLAVVTV